jgi:hypothetical protein
MTEIELAVETTRGLNRPGFAGSRGAISVVRAFCMATGRVPVHIFDFHLIARECNVNRSMYMSTRGTRQGQPHLRSNARAVDRSIALKLRYSDSDGPCGHCTHPFVPRDGQISRQIHRTTSRSPNTRRTAVHREVRPSKAPPARLPRRVRARRRGQFASKMRFRIANPWINRSWVNCDQMSFWFQKQERPPFKSIISRRALMYFLG